MRRPLFGILAAVVLLTTAHAHAFSMYPPHDALLRLLFYSHNAVYLLAPTGSGLAAVGEVVPSPYNMPTTSSTLFFSFGVNTTQGGIPLIMGCSCNPSHVPSVGVYIAPNSSNSAVGDLRISVTRDIVPIIVNGNIVGYSNPEVVYIATGVIPLDGRWHIIAASINNDNGGNPLGMYSVDGSIGSVAGQMLPCEGCNAYGPIAWSKMDTFAVGGIPASLTGTGGPAYGFWGDMQEVWFYTNSYVPLNEAILADFRDPGTGKSPGFGASCGLPLGGSVFPNLCHRGSLFQFEVGTSGKYVLINDPSQGSIPFGWALSDNCLHSDPIGRGCSSRPNGQWP